MKFMIVMLYSCTSCRALVWMLERSAPRPPTPPRPPPRPRARAGGFRPAPSRPREAPFQTPPRPHPAAPVYLIYVYYEEYEYSCTRVYAVARRGLDF